MLTTVLVLLLSPISTCDVSAPVSPVAAIEEFLATAPGYPEEAGVYENGVRNGNFVYFGPDGTIKKIERWNAVEPLLALLLRLQQTGVTHHPQVFRDVVLRQLQPVRDFVHTQLLLEQQS